MEGEQADLSGLTLEDQRAKWGSHLEFMLSCIGYSVGLGNVWRFPYLCYKHGGASFLLVYLFLQMTVGKPLYFLELSIGQYAGKNPVGVWDMNPAARGIGLSMCIISLNVALYYNVIMGYILFYFFASLNPELPWQNCRPEWVDCFTDTNSTLEKCKMPEEADVPVRSLNINCTCTGDDSIDQYYVKCIDRHSFASSLYFNKEVIQESANLSEFGVPSWRLALLLLLSWVIVLLCMIKGIKSTGKVVYFTAIFPYVVLLILLVRGATLNGAMDGVKFFIVPDWSELKSLQLWIDATGQMFFSLGLSMGAIIMFASFNYFHHAIYKDAVVISFMDLFTSLLAGFVIFTTFGFMAKETGGRVLDVATSSYGLAFVAYPETLGRLALPNLWSFLFFFMLYCLGLDSQFALLETITTYLIDDFVWCRHHGTLLRILFGIVLYCLGLILVCPGGQYLISIIDVYGASYPATVLCLLENISVMWVYGIRRFMKDLKYMLGHKPRCQIYWYSVWPVWSPLFLIGLNVLVLVRSETPKYADNTDFGPGVLAFCWLFYTYSLMMVPIWFFLHVSMVYRREGIVSWKIFIRDVFKPSSGWYPADGTHPPTWERQTSVWSGVLSWRILQRPKLVEEDSISIIPPPPQVKKIRETHITIHGRQLSQPAPGNPVTGPSEKLEEQVQQNVLQDDQKASKGRSETFESSESLSHSVDPIGSICPKDKPEPADDQTPTQILTTDPPPATPEPFL